MEVQAPYSEMVWSERELWSRDRIEAFQLAALMRQLAYVYERSDFSRTLFDAPGFHPAEFRSLADILLLPRTKKDAYLLAIKRSSLWGRQHTADPVPTPRANSSWMTSDSK